MRGNHLMTGPDSFPTIRFATADLPERDRIAIWREHYGLTIFKAKIEPVCDASFQATVVSRALPQLHLRYGLLSAVRVARTRDFLGDGNDDYALIINRTGRVSAAARGRDVSLGEGDGVLVSSGEMTAFDRTADGDSFTMRIPHAVLASLVADIDDAVMRLIPRTTGALRLLTNYAVPLLQDDALTGAELRLAVTHAHDLVALTLGATRAAAQVAPRRGLRAARLSAAKSYIVQNCTDPALSIGAVARYLEVTPRHLQKLFERDGGTFSAFLLDQRLARVYRALTNPKFDSRQVSAIVYDAGFGDISYFNRCFRHRFGAAPREIRGRPQN